MITAVVAVAVAAPTARGWRANEGFIKPLLEAVGDALCARKGPKFTLFLCPKWRREMEREYEYNGTFTLEERVLVCSFLAGVRYEPALDDYGAVLAEGGK